MSYLAKDQPGQEKITPQFSLENMREEPPNSSHINFKRVI
jgi:hypothetical protein